ncbi:unnamed protein product [Blepharisma stoltei]|uniref:Uncharacterized protein n=1 Tax=Blepharisma stoltei TaxID=1481888 RepID=A0AAU9J180_9CILI|nr:unnamed protein product [Blepharisma stoltei]
MDSSSGSEEEEVRGNEIVINAANTQYEVIQEVANILGWKLSFDPDDTEADVYWQDCALPPEKLSQLKTFQRINHFPGMYAVARKDHLGKNLKAMKMMFPEHYNFFPPTWILPKDYNDLKNQFNAKRAKTFICKPEASCQGRGIFLTRKLEEIPEHCVVQRYLHKPFLIEGLKFDLRVYVLIAGCDPLRMFIHKEGLVRLATVPYQPPVSSNLGDMCMHLTNYAINKNNPDFQFNRNEADDYSGHKRSLSTFMKKLEEQGEDVDAIWKRIGDVIVKTVCIVQPLLAHLYRSSQAVDPTNSICMQILGFDIFLDHKLKAHLLEVNHTPSFTTDTPLDSAIKKAVIGDALRMLGLKKGNRAEYLEKYHGQVFLRANRGIKEIRSMRSELQAKSLKEKQKLEKKFRGGYTRIYPVEDNTLYEQFMLAAKDIWLTNVGVKPKVKKETNLTQNPPSVPAASSIPAPISSKPSPIPKSLKSANNENRSKQKKAVVSASLYRLTKRTERPKIVKEVKLPALRPSHGSYIQPRIFEFSDSALTVIAREVSLKTKSMFDE